MKITNNAVASFHYTLKNDQGETIDSSDGKDPLTYLHGANNIIPGLEKELLDKEVGDKLKVIVPPAEGYGEYNAELVQELPSNMFSGVDNVEVGMEFHAQTAQGLQVVEVVAVENDMVTVNGNHPLAGQELHFDVEVTEVRAATKEELENGHVHGPDNNQ